MKSNLAGDAPAEDVKGLARSVMLQDTSEAVGTSWALECVNALRESGRPIEGGWPGTLPEARARILRQLPLQLSARGMLPLDAQEIGLVSSSTNAQAKRSWHLAVKRRPTQDG